MSNSPKKRKKGRKGRAVPDRVWAEAKGVVRDVRFEAQRMPGESHALQCGNPACLAMMLVPIQIQAELRADARVVEVAGTCSVCGELSRLPSDTYSMSRDGRFRMSMQSVLADLSIEQMTELKDELSAAIEAKDKRRAVAAIASAGGLSRLVPQTAGDYWQMIGVVLALVIYLLTRADAGDSPDPVPPIDVTVNVVQTVDPDGDGPGVAEDAGEAGQVDEDPAPGADQEGPDDDAQDPVEHPPQS